MDCASYRGIKLIAHAMKIYERLVDISEKNKPCHIAFLDLEKAYDRITIKKARIRDMEVNEKLYQRAQEEMEAKITLMTRQLEQLQRHYEIQKERLIAYKSREEKWEETRAELDEALYSKNNTVILLERELRDVKDELSSSWQAMKNSENDVSRMHREIEELKRTAELERKEYQESIADWRCRLENTVAENLATCAADVERNAVLALQMREKTDEAQRLQMMLEEEKKTTQRLEEELSQALRECAEAVNLNSKVVQLEAELARHDENDQKASMEHLETIRSLQSTYESAVEQHLTKISSAEVRIAELESDKAEAQQTIEDLQDHIAALSSEKKRIEYERIEIGKEMDRRSEVLKEALLIMDGMREEVAALTTKFIGDRGSEVESFASDLHDHLHHVLSVVESCCRQFEHLELRLAIYDDRRRRDIEDADPTETINDLQYRLFAADQRQAAYEKEKRELVRHLEHLQDSEQTVISENVKLKEQVTQMLEEGVKREGETEKMRDIISDLQAKMLSKSNQLSQITEAVRIALCCNPKESSG
ncbi:hypothetical protein Y032_0040g254 [Ancylostoma ceylanicum]|nr:hypothetical protein Y032_0040g254 [Ancylostoma ceylanicum]